VIIWNDDKRQFLKDNVKGITEKELQERFNKQFNCNASLSSVLNQKNKLHLSSGIVGGRFEKGTTSFNKGKKWDEYMSRKGQTNSLKTTFKKGNTPQNHRPVGSTRVTKDGYLEIKVKEPNKWETKHVVIWEQANGTIPDGYKLIFADGNRLNITLDNLILVSNAEELIMNKKNLIFNDKDLTTTGSLIAKVISKASKKRKQSYESMETTKEIKR
jgi:hypothetical protein